MSRSLTPLPPVIWRAAETWREVRDHYEATLNTARMEAYRQRLAASLDPYADLAVLERRQIAGLKVQAELRRRAIHLRLRKRLRAVPPAAKPVPQTPEPAAPGNVVGIRRRRR